jgi:hypothetical protein
MSICWAIQVLGLPLYHISWHVASTFINTDGVTFLVMILHMTPSIILIVITE